MPVTRIVIYSCKVCGRTHQVNPPTANYPSILSDLEAHMEGWWAQDGEVFCPDHVPDECKVSKTKTVKVYDGSTHWPNVDVTDLGVPYDPWYEKANFNLCPLCRYYTRGAEDDGSSWAICRVADPKSYYGHNLYDGHFHGEPAKGMLCPYWTNEHINVGRDPVKDKEDGVFKLPYDRLYDGD